MSFNVSYLVDSLISGLHYVHISLLLAFIPLIAGTILGTFVALARLFRVPVVSRILDVLVPLYNGIPVIVAMFIYNLMYLLYFKPSAKGVINVAFFTFIMAHTMGLSEYIRGAFLSVSKGQYEASYASGLTTSQTLIKIIIPQAIPAFMPGLTNMTVGAIKNSSIVLAIGVTEVLNGATIPCANTYSYLEGYVAAAIIYWALNIIAETLLTRAEKYFAKFRAGGSYD